MTVFRAFGMHFEGILVNSVMCKACIQGRADFGCEIPKQMW